MKKWEKMIYWEWEGGWSIQEVSSVSGTLRRCSGALLWEWAGCIPGEGCPPPSSRWCPGPWCAKIQVDTSDGTVGVCLPLRRFPNLWHDLCQPHALREQTGPLSHLSKLVCAPSVYGLVFCLFGQCRPSRSCHMGSCRPLLPVGFRGCGLWDSPASAWGCGVAESRCEPSGGQDLTDGLRELPDVRDHYRGFRWVLWWAGARAGSWPPVLVHMLWGVPVVFQGLGNVLLLLVSVGHECANPVGPGHQGPCHSNLVCKGVVGGEVQVAVCVGFLSVYWCGQGPITVVGDQSVQEREWPIWFLLHGELDRGFNRVEMVQEPIDLVFW